MPGVKKRDLHLANSVGDLNKMAGALPEIKNIRLCVTSAQKLFKKAEDTNLLGDEESAYVLYMKFFNFISGIKKTTEYKKNEKYYKDLIGMKNLLKAMDEAESLASSLKTRYEEREAETVSKKLEKLNENMEKEESTDLPELTEEDSLDREQNNDTAASKNNHSPKGSGESSEVEAGFITVRQLYSLLQDPDSNVLLMDVRAEDEFLASHISHTSCISVPYKIIPPGCTVNKIETGLPPESKALWDRRHMVDYIVMIDWVGNDNSLMMKSAMQSLKDAIYKWDQTKVVKSEPLAVRGGYSDILLYYPMIVTNAHVDRPNFINTTSTFVPSLDSIDYDLDLNFLKTPEQLAEEASNKNATIENLTEKYKENNSMPRVDRSMKPKPSSVNSTPRDAPLNTGRGKTASTAEFNKPHISYKLNDLRTELMNDSKPANHIKDTNVTEQGKVEIPKPHVPSVDRKLKPPTPAGQDPSPDQSEGSSTTSSRTSSTVSLDSTVASPKHPEIKTPSTTRLPDVVPPGDLSEEQIQTLRTDTQRIVREHKARLAKLKQEQESMSRLQEMKSKEVKETASLLRTKQQIQEEILQLEELLEEKERRMAAADEKWLEEQMHRHTEVDDKVNEGKESAKQTDSKPQDAVGAEKAQAPANVKQQGDDTRRADEKSKAESLRKEQEERDRLELETRRARERRDQMEAEARRAKEQRDQLEREAQARLKEEKARREAERVRREEEAKRLQQQREEQARREQQKQREEQARKEQQEKLRKEQEAKAKAEQEKKLADRKEQEKRMLDARNREDAKSKLVTPGLLVGWEKRLDANTGRYYYIDHKTKKTQWEPPQSPTPVPQAPGTTVKMRLKDEDEAPSSGGLKRSHSSPNIAKMMGDEKLPAPSQPLVQRSVKPKPRALTLQTDVSSAKVRNLQPVWGSAGRGLTGLKNLGNTCYMNSIIQCLSNTTPLTLYILTDNFREDINRENIFGKGGELAEEFAVLVKALWSGQYKSVSPRDFKMTVAKYHELFAGYTQQDSQELLLFLMDGLHEDLNRVVRRVTLPEQDNDGIPDQQAAEKAWGLHKSVNESVIVELFQGQFKSTVRCLSCGKTSVTFDAFMYLTLPIPSSTRCSVKDCLKHFSKEEKMSGESRWHCPRCKGRRDAVKQIVIWKLPPILLIHLKRFYYQGMWREKISAYVDFPLTGFDMNQFVCGPKTKRPYSLYGVSNHYGSLDGGHYTAYCKNTTAQRWCKYDDHEVYNISSGDIQSSAAYILFYSSMDMGPLFK